MNQAGPAHTTNPIVTVSDLALRQGEVRIRDLDLARALAMSDPHAIRRTIRKYATALTSFGLLVSEFDRKPSTRGGRPGTAFLLNRKQALYITAKSDTERAADATVEMVTVFDAYISGTLAKPVAVEGHRRARPQPRTGPVEAPAPAPAPRLDRDGFALMRLDGETLVVDLRRLDSGVGVRAVVIGWDATVSVQDMAAAESHRRFLGDRAFKLPDPSGKDGMRAVWSVGTVVASQPAAAPSDPARRAKGAAAKRTKPPRAGAALPPRPDLAVVEVCGRA